MADLVFAELHARVLVGRPGAGMLRVHDAADLAEITTRITDAYQKAGVTDGWRVHVILLHHTGKWAEQLLTVDPCTAAELGGVIIKAAMVMGNPN